MANNNNYDSRIMESRRNYAQAVEERKRECCHKPSCGGKVIPLMESNITFPGKDKMSESTGICKRCERYFERSSYYAEELEAGEYMFQSMLEQIKINANLSEEDLAMIAKGYDSLDTLATIIIYYNDMVKKLANGDGKKPRQRNTKGSMGLQPGMFGSRG